MELELRMLEENSGRKKDVYQQMLKKGRSGTKQERIGENDKVD